VYGGGAVGWDSFVSRISADGSHLEYSTFIGGTSSEWGTDISVDASGAAYIAGITQSTDFPVRAVDSFVAAGQIDASAGRSLLSKLEAAKQALSRRSLTGARSKVSDFRNQLSAQTGHSISPAAEQRLIADADYVIGTLH
jgi:FIMAH domain